MEENSFISFVIHNHLIYILPPLNKNHRTPLANVTDRYRPLPNFTVTCVTCVTDRNIVCFEQIFKVLLKN